MDKQEKMNKWDRMDEQKKIDKWEKIVKYGRILTKHNTTVTELIYFWTMSKNRSSRGDIKKKVLLELSLRELKMLAAK